MESDVKHWMFVIWGVGNLVLPALPVFMVWGVRKFSSRAATFDAVVRDGILFFYIVTLAAILMMDAAKYLLARTADQSEGFAVAALAVCVPIMVVSSGAYLAMALAHAGSLDREGDALDLEKLGRVSWRLALLAAILCAGFRYWSGLY
jgi:hypothetical protein